MMKRESSLSFMYKFLLLDKYYRPVISTLTILVIGPILLLQTYYFLTNLECFSFFKYSAYYTGLFYALTTNILYPIMVRFYMPRVKAFSMKKRKYVTKFKTTYLGFIQLLLITTTCITASTTVYTLSQLEDESNPTWLVLNYYVSLDDDIYVAINWIIFILFLALCYPSSAACFYFIYLISHLDLQLLLLTDDVNRLKKRNITKSGLTLKSLKSIVRGHVQMIKYNRSILKENEILNMVYVVNGIMVNCWSIFTLLKQGVDEINGVMLLVTFSLYNCCLNYVAQNYVNDSLDFINAVYGLRWYKWNGKCQKFYLTMVTNISKEFKVPVSLMGHGGNELLKNIFRLTYTMKCVLSSVKK